MSARGRPAEWAFLAACVVSYTITSKGYLEVSDTYFSLQTATALVREGSWAIPPADGATLAGRDGHYSKYGIGLPLYYAPVVAGSDLAARFVNYPPDRIAGFVLSFATVPFALLAVWSLGRLLDELGVGRPARWLAVLGFAFGTLCWKYAGSDFTEGQQLGVLTLAVLGVVRGTRRWALVAGSAVGAAVLLKVVNLLLVPVFVAYVWRPGPGPAGPRAARLAAFLGPVACSVVLILVANAVRFGSPLESGYGREAGEFHFGQLPETLPGLLVSPGKGVFVFCPVLVLSVAGLYPFLRRRPREALLCGALVGVNLVWSGAWHSWVGGWSWGPRLIVPLLACWAVPLAFWLDGGGRWRRWVGAAAVAASVLAQLPGVLVKDQLIHHIRYNVLTAEERQEMVPDYPAGWLVLLHKLRVGTDSYPVGLLGVAGGRDADVSGVRTFRGLNVWTEHTAREFHRPVLRWVALPLAALAAWLMIRAAWAAGGRSEPAA